MMTFAMMSSKRRAKNKNEAFLSVNPKESLKIGLNRVSLTHTFKLNVARMISRSNML